MTTRSGSASEKTRCSTGAAELEDDARPFGTRPGADVLHGRGTCGGAAEEERADHDRPQPSPLRHLATSLTRDGALCLPTFLRLFNVFFSCSRELRVVIKRLLTKRA